jgi:imidazolonepropionase-like amidohydrolase
VVVAERADVVIRSGRIEVVGTGTGASGPELDLAGRTVVPGLMNAHAHISLDGSADPDVAFRSETPSQRTIRSAARLRETLGAGVTTIRDVGGPASVLEVAAMVASGELPGPRMLAAGQVVTITGGHGHWMGIESDGPDAARRAVRQNIKGGATAIKLMATGGMMTAGRQAGVPQLTVEEMSAAVEEAHKRGLPVGAHAESKTGVMNALRAGVDSIEHGHGGDTETIELMLRNGQFLVPTILSDRRIIEADPAAGIPVEVVEQCSALHSQLVTFLQAAIRAGVKVAAGNDGGAPLVQNGEMVPELQLYVDHGMTPLQALASATRVTAELFRLPDVGLVEPGYVADLLVVDRDPVASVSALASPRHVIQAGRVVASRG